MKIGNDDDNKSPGDPNNGPEILAFLADVQGVTMRTESGEKSCGPDKIYQGDWMNSVLAIYKTGLRIQVIEDGKENFLKKPNPEKA